MERCGRLNGKKRKTKWKEAEDKMERCGRQMGKSGRLSVAVARLNHLKFSFRPIAISMFNVSFEHNYEG